ncbi:MAG TPA: hypothetical protein VE222_01245, partial [Nitrospiraceae bacterium]|nr:hypothetical protein [Nitrospiraceae bacterium]
MHETAVGGSILIRWLGALWCLLFLGFAHPAPAAETDTPSEGRVVEKSENEQKVTVPESRAASSKPKGTVPE